MQYNKDLLGELSINTLVADLGKQWNVREMSRQEARSFEMLEGF